MQQSPFTMENKTVVVTGGAQGIGKTVAHELAAAGASIVIVDTQLQQAQNTAQEIQQQHGRMALALAADVTNPAQVAAAIHQAAEEMGPLDCLFNNAGIVLHKPALDLEPDEWRRVIDVNLNGVFFVAQAFARHLVANKRPGSIVNTASMSGSIVNYPQPQASYNASKAAVVHLTKSLAVEWIDKGIRVNCISPGYIKTDLTCHVDQNWQDYWMKATPAKRYGTPQELAGAVMYLFSDASSFTTGCEMVIDGGFTLI